jgi:hypothetical protein
MSGDTMSGDMTSGDMTSIDVDIAAWAATVRLPDADADEIFQRIVSTPVRPATASPALAPAWWRSFNAGYAARMVASTMPARRAA